MSHIIAKPGDIIGFSGRSPRSDAINLLTGGIPRWSISHVGIVGRCLSGELYLFEATEALNSCKIHGTWGAGFQAHRIEFAIDSYRGRVWHYPLYRRLYAHELLRLTTYLDGILGTPYDKTGAINSGGWAHSWINALIKGQDLLELFCSEAAAAAESRIGIFPTTNASRWSPNKLVRTMRRAGLLCKPKRVK
jgi:hypothetical protein